MLDEFSVTSCCVIFRCAGTERLLSQCSKVTGPTRVYGHERDAGVICNVPQRDNCDIPVSKEFKCQSTR